MKKLMRITVCAVVAFLGILCLTACGQKKAQETQDNISYTVTANESDFYNINAKTTRATAGMNAFVEILPQFEAVKIDKVYYNEAEQKECTKSTTDDNRYEFVMPNENVTITVKYSFVDNEEDNFLGWDTANDNTFSIFVESADDSYYAPLDDGTLTANVIKNPSQSGGYFSSHTETVFSLDETVIPNEALDIMAVKNGSVATAFVIHINRTLIHEGETQLIFKVNNGHKFGDASLLVCTIRVDNA